MEAIAKEKISLGWSEATVGELDHRLVKAPYVRLSSQHIGVKGDSVYVFDLRVSQPNTNYLTTKQLHSMEHALLAGFRKYLPDNFVNVAPMGCQTGFYLVTLNEGRAKVICDIYAQILQDILTTTTVPYQDIKDCGQYLHHDLLETQELATSLLKEQANWLQIL